MRQSRAASAAWLIPSSVLALGVATIALNQSASSSRREPLPEQLAILVLLLAWSVVGAVIIWRRPRHPVGWVVAVVGLAGAFVTAGDRYATPEPALPLRDWVYWATSLCGPVVPVAVVVTVLLFPDGRTVSPRWRVGVVTAAVAMVLMSIGVALAEYTAGTDGDSSNIGHPWLENPTGAGVAYGDPLLGGGLGWLAFLVSAVTAFASLVVRFRRSGPDVRRQMKWLVLPVGITAVGFLASTLDTSDWRSPVAWVVDEGVLITGLATMPVAIGLAILRHRLFDIDVLVRRTAVYAVLWLAIGGVYIGLSAMPGLVVADRLPVEAAVLLTVVAAVTFQPARHVVDRLVGRLVFGDRPSEFELLSRFGETVADAFDATELAPRVADTVRQGLDLRWARVVLDVGDDEGAVNRPAGASGIGLDDPSAPVLSVPLIHGDERLGAIECGPKREGRFLDRDHSLLASLSRQAALGTHNARLAAQLSARLDEIRRQASELAGSRARIVAAQETERQRIERDLHDGVQQHIVSLLARLSLARAQLRRDPIVAETTLAELHTEIGQILSDLRELAQGIHPPVLTDRGLLEAIEARLARVPIGVEIHATADLRGARFAPDIEAGAYFFISEALTNAMKHASPSRVVIRLAVADLNLTVEVDDDGVGFDPSGVSGTGLTGLRDRIEALGGRVQVHSRPGTGSRLTATIPTRLAPAAAQGIRG